MKTKVVIMVGLLNFFLLTLPKNKEQNDQSNLINYWKERGVTFDIPETVYIEETVIIGSNTRIAAGVYLTGKTEIGNNVVIGPYSVIENSTINDNVQIKSHTVISESILEKSVKVGPMTHIHKSSHLKEEAKIGNFVEISQSLIGKKTKAYHLSLIEHAIVGDKVNIGGGTITSDYDGKNKFKTIIKDKVFVGSNNTLVAPITLEEGCFTAAGSVITYDVPAHALGIGRSRQINKENYAQRLMYHPKKHTHN